MKPQSKNKKSNCEMKFKRRRIKQSLIARNEIKWQLQYHIVRYKDRKV